MGKKSRDKGASAEREVCKILRDYGPWANAERDLEQVRGSDNGRDIINTQPWVFQVKRRKSITRDVIMTGIVEAISADVDNEEYYLAACIHRSDYQDWSISMLLGDFLIWLTGDDGPLDARIEPLITLDFKQFCVLSYQLVRDEC